MKKCSYFLFAIILFLSFNTAVNAKTRCEYTWRNTFFSTETDQNGNKVAVNDKFYLETEGNDNKLTKAVSPYSNMSATFANGDGINLENGKCPTISIYSQNAMGGYKIYKSNSSCKDGFLTVNSRCSENLSGTAVSTDTSISNDSNSATQYKLKSSTSEKCEYANSQGSSTNTITITKRGSNNVSGSCEASYVSICRVQFDIAASKFYSGNNFSCPAYIYTRTEEGGRMDGTNRIYHVIDSGTSNDNNTSGTGDRYIDSVTIGDPANIGCSDIFQVDKEGSVGWILSTILNYIKVIGPILVVILSALDFIKAIFSSDDKAIKEAQSKLTIRLIAALALFLVPTLVQLLLSFINATTCTDF